MNVKVAQSCPFLCNPMDYTFHGIFQARILGWVDIPFPGDLPNPGIEPRSPTLQQILYQLRHQGKKKIWSQSWAWRKALSQDALPEQYRVWVKNNPHQIALKVPMELKAFSLTDPFLSIHTAKNLSSSQQKIGSLLKYWTQETKSRDNRYC